MRPAREYCFRVERHGGSIDEQPESTRRLVPGKQTEVERLLARLEGSTHEASLASQLAPGRRTLVDQAVNPRFSFDDCRVRALSELLRWINSSDELKAQLVAAASEADRSIVGRATRWCAPGSATATPDGTAMWCAAERHAVTLYRRALADQAGDLQDPAIEGALQKRGEGQPLALELRRELERELGVSLAGVRIHTDDVAEAAARALHAEAFTVGEDVFFAAGAFAPDTLAGRRLVAHELAHVAQAVRGSTPATGTGLRVSDPGEPLEREADAVATRFVETPSLGAQAEAPDRSRGTSQGRSLSELFAAGERHPPGIAPGASASTLFRSSVDPAAPDTQNGSRQMPSNIEANDDQTHPGRVHYQLKPIPLAVGDVARVNRWAPPPLRVTPEHPYESEKQNRGGESIPKETYVRVLELGNGIARVEVLDGPSGKSGGKEFGWVRIPKLVRLARAPRPSTADAQMSRLLAVARANHVKVATGLCFTYVKNYIALAGGYGDILDIHTDPRFDGMGIGGKDFAAQVDRVGPAELGLEKVDGRVMDQDPGTILCTRGNGQNKIDLTYGDIAVIDRNDGGSTICYNDGIIPFGIDEKHWAKGGMLEDSVVAMFRPLDRE